MHKLQPNEVSWIIEEKIRNGPHTVPHTAEAPPAKKLEAWPWPKSSEGCK